MKRFPGAYFFLMFCVGSSLGSCVDSGSDPLSGSPFAVERRALWDGGSGAETMHGDTFSSDTTPKPGPGIGDWNMSHRELFGACSTVLIRSDGYPMVLCTAWLGRDPTIRILDPDSSRPLAKLKLPSGSLLGGVYAYLDDEDRLVMVDGDQNLIRVAATQTKKRLRTTWSLEVVESVPLASEVTGHCGGGDCDAVVSISPDGDGAVWFATRSALVGIYDPASERIHTTLLAGDEAIHNSFSTTGDGRAAVATDRALYLIKKDEEGRPSVKWRRSYDRGAARKPGQLSWGTGATPTFFRPGDGTDYVMITDNADEQINLLVFRAGADSSGGEIICRHPLFAAGASGTENSAIGIGRTVIAASTYGYPYPAVPEGAGSAVPESADFRGGMVRVDIRPDASGCELIWENDLKSCAVPKLSIADELIYTVERRSASSILKGGFDSYHFTAVDPESGAVVRQNKMGSTTLRDTLQMAGNIGDDGVYWQGTLSGIARIAPQ